MIKKNNFNPIKLIKFYKLINHNLIYNNRAINRYKKDNFEISADKTRNLEILKKSINSIKNCSLKKHATNMVFSDGNPKSKIMLIGEAPGANEDEEGLPFVGRAGALLDKMLSAIDLDRKKVYISNIINYRPNDNRKPTDEEIMINTLNSKECSDSESCQLKQLYDQQVKRFNELYKKTKMSVE